MSKRLADVVLSGPWTKTAAVSLDGLSVIRGIVAPNAADLVMSSSLTRAQQDQVAQDMVGFTISGTSGSTIEHSYPIPGSDPRLLTALGMTDWTESDTFLLAYVADWVSEVLFPLQTQVEGGGSVQVPIQVKVLPVGGVIIGQPYQLPDGAIFRYSGVAWVQQSAPPAQSGGSAAPAPAPTITPGAAAAAAELHWTAIWTALQKSLPAAGIPAGVALRTQLQGQVMPVLTIAAKVGAIKADGTLAS